jgi:replicative DNA helicase
MASPDAKSGLTDKQIVDKNVLELKRISRDFKTPVIAISNLNRDAYNKELTMASFKETGAIEYTADGLIGLQFAGVEDKDFDEDRAKTRESPTIEGLNERTIELKILKNRNGRTGGRCQMFYYPAFDLFREADA